MLEDADPVATVAVKDLAAARRFYEGTLGLKVLHQEGEEAVDYQAGRGRILVYRSQFAATNQATAVTWMVRDIEAAVRGLKNAWFKDPDGNIHALVGGGR